MRKLFLLFLFAICYLLSANIVRATEPNCWCTGANGSACTRYSDSCPSGDAQAYEGFSICCNDKNLYNSVFAMKSPICGSAMEKPIIGCENGTFADGNTMLFCVGNEFRLDRVDVTGSGTNPVFNGLDNIAFNPGGSFSYNGNSYSGNNVYVCNSIASCCAQGSAGFKCADIYKPNPYNSPALVDNNTLPNAQRAALCGLTGDPNDDLVRYVHSNIEQYELTCADTPVVDVVRATCSEIAGGEGAPYGKITQRDPSTNQDYIDIQALVSLASANLGGYGPDVTAQRVNTLDALAKVYPFNAFLNSTLKIGAPREAFGTFWRLLNQLQQMNAKAKLFMRYKQQTPPMRDQDIVYSGDNAAQESDVDGAAIAKYMNAVITGVAGEPKIKLLSPAFNITSRFTPPLVAEMISAGANFAALAGCAGNTYTVDGQGAYSWYQSFLSQTGLSGKCKGFVFTEFGDFDTFGKPLDGRPDVISRMTAEFAKTSADTSVLGALYFNAMGGNPQFSGHQLSQTEYSTIVSSNPGKAGVNSAKPFDGGVFEDAAGNYMGGPGWTLEIAFSKGDADSVVNAINRALSRGLTPVIRICVGNTCDFADPSVYAGFLRDVASRTSGAFYAIAGPNEPETEQWVGTVPGDIPTPPPKTIKLSSLMSSLPGCLSSYPVCEDASAVYTVLDPDTKIKYDALIPFNQDNLRGYLGLNYIEPVERRTNVGILTEGLPYIETVKEVLDDPNFGILSALSPDWVNAARLSQSTSENYITPQQEKNNASIIERVAEKARQIWPSDTKEDDPEKNVLGCFLHEKGVTLPAPTTYPRDFPVVPAKPEWEIKSEPFPKSLYQFLRVPVKTTETANSDKCPINVAGLTIGHGTYYETKIVGDVRRDPGSYLVSNIGRSIAVLNNPKMTDISTLISEPKGDTNYSITSMMLPGFAKTTPPYVDTPLLANGASYDSTIYIYTDPATIDTGKAGGTESTSGKIARKGGQAHIDLCTFRNFWLRPAGLQRGTPADCSAEELTGQLSTPPLPVVTPALIPTQANCNKSAPAGSPGSLLPVGSLTSQSFASGADYDNLKNCYNDLVSRSNSASYDPAFTMAIWLEESAASWYKSYPNVADFGCAVNTARMDFNAQIGCFLSLQRNYASGDQFKECRGSDDSLSMREFLLIYEGGYQSCRAGDFTIEPQFPTRIQQYYSQVTGGQSLDFNAPL